MSLPVLKTERLTLRPLTTRDLPAVVRLAGDYEVSKMMSLVPHPYGHEDAVAWFNQHADQKENGERAFAIDNGEGLIGVISVGRPVVEPDFGYWLGKPYWGRGYMTEAGRAVLSWLFEVTPEVTIMSGALTENPASLNVLGKLGFDGIGPYRIPVRARGEELPGTRMKLDRTGFLARLEDAA